ncbi:MAG TPA: TM2 domain-containing protein [Candidatus Limnocylindria bacterium]|nr:TM2 domain-containing protein [Candidatus Limnocylindria bacterium]
MDAPKHPPTTEVPTNPEQKDFLVALLLSIFLGQLGIDRFYMGYIGLGILKLVTFGGCGIWWLVDVILIATKNLKDADGRELKGS